MKEVLLMEGMKEEYAEEPKVEAALQVVVLGEEEYVDKKETEMRMKG